MKKIALLGSTGSIGTQCLEIVREHPDRFSVELLVAHSNHRLLLQQAKEFKPAHVVIINETHYQEIHDTLWNAGIKVYGGYNSVLDLLSLSNIEIVLNAIVGAAGTRATIKTLQEKKILALANKESLVVAGELVSQIKDAKIIPIDSEHAAIFQCLLGENLSNNPIESLILTASGGAFLHHSEKEMQNISLKEALKHPNWNMGKKITIDSATMMNKGLEMIEAKWLFGVSPRQIKVLIHPQSIIHSLVEFFDGSMKAQMGVPNMKIPISFALSYPKRERLKMDHLNLETLGSLQFEKPNPILNQSIELAYQALEVGGTLPCVLNAANEACVYAFMNGKIPFLDIIRLTEKAMNTVKHSKVESLEQLEAIERETQKYIQKRFT